ncbi:MAG TPA: multidrug effflux MFS transporter [Devosiaceae bacterium]
MDSKLLKLALILGLMSAIGPFAIDMYLPALPDVAAEFDAPVAYAQWTLMAFFVAFGVSQLFYGPASDMFGRKPPIYFGLAVFSLASIGCALAPSIEVLIALRFIQGIGAAAVMSIPRAIIRDLYTGAKATRLMSTIMLVISVSPMLAPLVGSTLIVPFGWRSVFVAVMVATAVSLALALFALPETRQRADRSPFEGRAMLRNFGTLLRDPSFMGLTFIGGLGMSAFFTFLASSSFIYMEFYGLTPTQFSLAFAINALGFFSASQFAANLTARLGAERLIRLSTFGYSLVSLALLGLFAVGAGSLPLLVGLLVLSNVFMGFIMPSSMVLALENHGPIAGAAASLGGTMQMLLGALAMVVSSLLFNGTPIPMLSVIGVCAFGALVLAIVTVRSPSVQPAE